MSEVDEVRDCISEFYNIIIEGYFLGITGKEVFETRDKNFAATYAVVGKRNRKR
ncbi:MAG: hypothetical protein AB1598_03555 [Thermodesulfobacteriota bacterium]